MSNFGESLQSHMTNSATLERRGDEQIEQGNFQGAIESYRQAITLEPTNPKHFLERGRAYERTAQFRLAISDFDEAIRLDPRNVAAHFSRGVAHFYQGSLQSAREDFAKANQLDPTYPAAAFWLEIADRKGSFPSRFAQTSALIDMSKWPAVLVRYYRNEGTAAQVLAAAAVPDPAKSNGQMCEAHFYIAQRELQNGNIPAARKLFELALQGCPKSYSAWLGSNLEIRDRRPRLPSQR
jgi:lipoprotein NlpI